MVGARDRRRHPVIHASLDRLLDDRDGLVGASRLPRRHIEREVDLEGGEHPKDPLLVRQVLIMVADQEEALF